jgi:Putative ATPase subunit of terminase (gpP-like)
MGVTPANRDRLREQAFALSAQGFSYRDISARLGIDKGTVQSYVRIERERRSHDRHAEDAVRDAIASLRSLITDLHERYDRIEGDTPHAMYARAKVAEIIRRSCRDLIALYGITLPETDPEIVSMKRMLKMMEPPFSTPGGYPAVGEQAIIEEHRDVPEQQLAGSGLNQTTRTPAADDPGDFRFDGPGEVGDSYFGY